MSTTKPNISVVTDSAAALSQEQLSDHQIFVSRMEITIDGNTYIDGPDSGIDNFYSMLEESTEIPTTSAPQPEEYLDRFREAAELSDSIFCISVSAKLSAAYDAALTAARLFENEQSATQVRVFDSGTAASSQALMTLAAARAATAGASIDEVEAVARKVAANVRLVAMLDTLKYIHRSGRVPKIAMWATSALNIKPVMEYSAGNVGPIARPISVSKAIERIQKEMRNNLSGEIAHVNIMHAGALDRAEYLKNWVSAKINCAELFITQFHPFMGAHTGPGLVGASWWAE
jgi:DegV family protein with EDD domain